MQEGVLRFELEYVQNGDAEKTIFGEKVKVKSRAIFANGYFDFDTNSAFRPYLGIGFGHSKVKLGDKKENEFAFNYSAGVSYMFNENTALDFGYRYTSYANFEEEIITPLVYEKFEYKAYANELLLGVRFSF